MSAKAGVDDTLWCSRAQHPPPTSQVQSLPPTRVFGRRRIGKKTRQTAFSRSRWDSRFYFLYDRLFIVTFDAKWPTKTFEQACSVSDARLRTACGWDRKEQRWSLNTAKGCRFTVVKSDLLSPQRQQSLGNVFPHVGEVKQQFTQVGITFQCDKLANGCIMDNVRSSACASVSTSLAKLPQTLKVYGFFDCANFVRKVALPKICFGAHLHVNCAHGAQDIGKINRAGHYAAASSWTVSSDLLVLCGPRTSPTDYLRTSCP